ncbi:unnamed protein product [Prorocentrum cordatum]|uniref:BTB domain-containing protein n=1 Tax=Prorocentrum cordatum TaxID=2364126 RepID=A0ABN9XG14_9DINO|nr:unnamed protein product [Polarella glacialis]
MPPKAAVLKRPAAAKCPEPEPEEVEDEEEEPEESAVEEPAAESAAELAARVMHVSATKSAPPTSAAGGAPAEATPSSPAKPAAPEPLRVRYEAADAPRPAPLRGGLLRLQREGRLCDAALLVAGERLPVHRVVLAAHSDDLGDRSELDLQAMSREAADILLLYLYGEVADAAAFSPSSGQVLEEVLQLAFELGLAPLAELCAARLAADTDVANVAARVRLCEQRGLPRLREALVRALLEDGAALQTVAQDAVTVNHPALMQELLAAIAQQARAAAEADGADRPRKQARCR